MNRVLEQIREAKDLKNNKIHIAEWGVDIVLVEPVRRVVKELQERHLKLDLTTGQQLKGSDTDAFAMALIAEMAHDEKGEKVFANAQEASEVLNEKSTRVQTRLIEQCGELVRLPTEEDVENAERD